MNRAVVYFLFDGFQLGDVDRVGIRHARGEVGDLSCLIRRAYRDGTVSGFPCRSGFCGYFSRERVIPGHFRGGIRYRAGPQSDPAFHADISVITEDGYVRCFRFRFRFQRADNNISVHVFQLVVIAQYQVMTRVDDGVPVPGHDIVGYSRFAVRIGNFVTHTRNTGIDGARYRIAVSVNSDMASFFFKQSDRTFRRILIITQIAFQLFLFISGHDFVIIRVSHIVAYAADKGAMGVCNIIFAS